MNSFSPFASFELKSLDVTINTGALGVASSSSSGRILGVTVESIGEKVLFAQVVTGFKFSSMDPKLPALDPVVIPSISHRPFRCEGKGLTYKNHSRESIDNLKTWLQPNKRLKTVFKRAKDWWRAQLLLYGLDAGKSTAKVEELTTMLTTAVKEGLQGPSQKIIDLENELNTKFRVQNAEARDEKYLTLETEESRVEFYPLRFWRERFPSKGRRKKNEIVTLTVRFQSVHRVKTAAESLGLSAFDTSDIQCYSLDIGIDMLSKLVVGIDRGAVLQLKAQMEEKREKQLDEAARLERQEKEEAARLERQAREAKAQKLAAQFGPGEGTLKDVVGEWHVQSHAISDQWPQFGTDFEMCIYFHNMENDCDHSDEERSYYSGSDANGSAEFDGTELIWANFEMGILSGVLHANKHLLPIASFPCGPIPFAWRGRESGEGQIEVDTDGTNNIGTVTFLGPTQLNGELKSTFGDFKFEGYKASSAPRNKAPEEWHGLDYRRWNKERVSRWH
ncbi:hypothetical protein R1sor_016470 [Riccia sorocarpa]|uniref:Uncharacterized protein n=1 Tax=Riccia sorocarpa TaxID=122646 RepID=A0ABD3HJ83_9MARC